MGFPSFALLLVLLFLAGTLQAQKSTDAVYTSPGSPLIVNRRVIDSYNSSSSRPSSVVVPRFWRNPDSLARAEDAAKFKQLLAGRTRFHQIAFPQTIHDTDFSVHLVTRVVINEDGTLQAPVVLEKKLPLPETNYPPEMIRALEQEAKRVVSTLRFTAAASPDVMLVPLSFSLQ